MKYGIIGALDEEVFLLKNNMRLDKVTETCGCAYYEGELDGKDVVIVCCSVGKVNAAVCTSILIREFGCDAVVNTGIAGAMGAGLKPLNVVISSDVVLHDVSDFMERYYPYTISFKADEKLIKAAAEAVGEGVGYRVGRIATGDQFIEGGELYNSIKSRFDPDAVEMEGGAVAQACYMNKVPFVIIRTMSDSADDSASETYDNLMGIAAKQSSEILRRMLKSL